MQINKIDTNSNKYYYPRQDKPAFRRVWEEHVSWGAKYITQTGKTNFKIFSFPDAKAVFVEVADKAVIGLQNMKERIVQVLATAGFGLTITGVLPKDENSKIFPMTNKGNGVFEAENIDATPNNKYRYIVVDANNNVNLVKHPYSKEQDSINGWSSIYDSSKYKWKNTDWLEGKDPRRIIRNKKEKNYRGLEKLIINEVNIPTLSKEGTFDGAKHAIDKIASDGIATAIELLPVENTYSLQWGYDGVDKFAVNSKMGGADKLKEFIDYAHEKGLNVIMDMVPNHMGPDGDYLTQTGPYEKGAGKFGGEFNYEGKNNRYVRDWMVNAALWWANEFKVDGLRLDMTKLCGSDYLLKQIVSEVNEHNPNVFLIAEDARENKESVTRYEFGKPNHENELDFIDSQIGFIADKGWFSTPQNIGFDSEWDFRLMHTLKNGILAGGVNLDDLEEKMKNSMFRVKYVMSHDEIGNEDGTRLIPKIISRTLDLYSKVSGNTDAEKGQRAAQASQQIAKIIVSKEFDSISESKLQEYEKNIGLNSFIDKQTLINAFNTAIARQKLAQGTVLTIPGPKMFFQGDEYGDLSQFKFFREFSDEKKIREQSDDLKNRIINEKGYDTLESVARQDCIVGDIKSEGMFANIKEQIKDFNKKLVDLIHKNPALLKGELVGTFKDNNPNVHIHHLKKGDNEILVIKNYGQGFFNKNYSYFGFPSEGTWAEILSSDSEEFGGAGYSNENRKDITNNNQNLSLAPNSLIVLKRIK